MFHNQRQEEIIIYLLLLRSQLSLGFFLGIGMNSLFPNKCGINKNWNMFIFSKTPYLPFIMSSARFLLGNDKHLFLSVTTTDFLVCCSCLVFLLPSFCFELTSAVCKYFASGNSRKNSSGFESFRSGNTSFRFMVQGSEVTHPITGFCPVKSYKKGGCIKGRIILHVPMYRSFSFLPGNSSAANLAFTIRFTFCFVF